MTRTIFSGQNLGWLQSEDLAFCDLWRKSGNKIHVLPDIELRHYGSTEYVGALAQSVTTPL